MYNLAPRLRLLVPRSLKWSGYETRIVPCVTRGSTMPQRPKSLVTAFNLVPVVEQVLPDRQKVEVECVSIWEKSLYVGTTCGLIVYYHLEENKTPLGKIVYQCKVRGRIQLGGGDRKRVVQQLTVIPSQKKLLALLDGYLYVMHMNTLELFDTGQRVSKIQCYCVNESKVQQHSGTFEVIVAPQRKKVLQMHALSGEKLVHIRDFSIPEPALAMARDSSSVCVALQPGPHGDGRYIVVNVTDGGKVIDLMSYDAGANPIVKRTGKGEFLLNAGTFGIIAFASGVSNRPPVEWHTRPPKSATYVFPYVVAWCDVLGVIHVYNLLDQRCVQEIPFQNGRFLGEFQGKLYAALDKSVYLLSSVPLKEQVSTLLDKHLVEEAVLMAETIAAVEATKNKAAADEYMCEVKQKAAFIYFTLGTFSQAEALFLESGCDPREVIVLFEGLLPASTSFKSKAASLHGIPSVETLALASEQLSVTEAKKFLIRYLKEVRASPLALGRREDIDTSLVKLLAEERSPSLIPYLTNHDLYLAFEETKDALEKYSCYHALGLLYYYSNQASQALTIWTRIYDGELKDKEFPGFHYIIDFLAKHSNAEVVLKYAQWALERYEEEAVKIFTDHPGDQLPGGLRVDKVLEFLSPFPTATVAYLEHLIHEKGSQYEGYHTTLAHRYLDYVLVLIEEGSTFQQLQSARDKLKQFLEISKLYRAPELLGKLQDTDLHLECAILYGRMEEHEKALSLLARQLKDYQRAKSYCGTYSQGRSRQYRQNIYQTLLAVYLRPKDKTQDLLIQPALSLLNSHGAAFDAAQVLELLPPDWPVSTVKAFLMHSLRSSIDTYRTMRIEHNLARGENLQVRSNFIDHQGDPVVITQDTRCPVCNMPFNDAAFVRYPNGIVTHLKCGRNKSICPVTGMWFGDGE